MPYRLMLGLGAPLLWWQGRWVRRTLIQLPEAAGARHGIRHQPGQPELRVLVLGDSAAAGVGVTTQTEALSGQLADHLASTHSVHWHCLATTGLTVAGVLAALQDWPAQPLDAVVISAGVNDVTALTPVSRWVRQYRHLLDTLQRQHQPRLILCTALPPLQAFSALPQPLRWTMGQRARHLNRALRQLTTTQPGTHLLEPELPLQPSSLAVDGFHPSAQAYQHWARAAALAIRARLRPG